MSLVPKNKDARIEFYENHIAPWTTNATNIGTSTSAVTDLETKTEAARAAYIAREAAYSVARAATTTLDHALQAMSDAGASVIDQIRAKARISGNGVYGLAQIPPPAVPSPKPAPGTPSGLKVVLDGNGALHLGWKCANPKGTAGTIYQVWRQVGGSGSFVYVGGSGERKLVDTTVPAGATYLTYQIQAVRTTAVGMWATFNVYFGTNAAAGTTASVMETEAPKIAA